jgi:hypothetical protein
MPAENPKALVHAVNVVLLTSHQVDAAYWHEWEVFGVPGGVDAFLAFNLAAVLVLVLGLVRVATGHPSAPLFSRICGGTGVVTVGLHAVFLFLDREAFWSPMSLGLLVAIAITSAAQLALAGRGT